MTLLSPAKLWLLLLVAALAVGYVMLQRQRRKRAVRHPDVRLVAAVSGKRASWRRHLVAGALGFAIIALIVGLARPAHSEEVPRREAVVMLVIDQSASMAASDVAPTRLEAAAAEARRFITNAPAAFKIGLIGFDDNVHVLANPTTVRSDLFAAIDQLALGHGTASGEALYTALEAIKAASGDAQSTAGRPYTSVILLADGASNVGRPLADAAQAAADQHVPVYTIAFGTPNGTFEYNGQQIPVPVDTAALAGVAEKTGGQTFSASSGNQLASVYDEIGTTIGHITVQRELVVACALAALVAMVVALGGSLLWNPRLV